MKRLLAIVIFLGLLMGCSNNPASTPTALPVSTSTTLLRTPTVRLTEIPLTATFPLSTETATAIPPTAIPPTATPLPACVTLHYGEYAQFEIISPTGQRVLVDIYDPEKLSSPAVDGDILLTTHTHWDHVNEDFLAAFPGQQLFAQVGNIDLPGVNIQGIASAHNAGDRLKPEGGTNYLYVIDIAGLRIAHFGDIGQNTLTDEQLGILGKVDIAITQLNNPYSEMNAENRKGIHLMEQVQPGLVIPTHLNLDTVKLAVVLWPGFYAETPSVEICKSDLSKQTQILLMGEAAGTMVKYVDLAEWENPNGE